MTTQNIINASRTKDPYAAVKTPLRKTAKLSDEQILQIAINKTQKDVADSKTAKLYKALPAITVSALTAASMIAKPGAISKKLGAGALTLGYITGGSLILNKVFSSIDKIKNPKNEDSKMNPYVKAGLQVAGSVGVLMLSLAALSKGKSLFTKGFPYTTDGIRLDKLDIAEKIDDSKIAKHLNKIGTSVGEFFNKHTNLKKVGKITLNNSFPITVLSYFLAATGLKSALSKKAGATFEKNVGNLQDLREDAQLSLAFIKKGEKTPQKPQSDAECDASCMELKMQQNAAIKEITAAESAKAEQSTASEDIRAFS